MGYNFKNISKNDTYDIQVRLNYHRNHRYDYKVMFSVCNFGSHTGILKINRTACYFEHDIVLNYSHLNHLRNYRNHHKVDNMVYIVYCHTGIVSMMYN